MSHLNKDIVLQT